MRCSSADRPNRRSGESGPTVPGTTRPVVDRESGPGTALDGIMLGALIPGVISAGSGWLGATGTALCGIVPGAWVPPG